MNSARVLVANLAAPEISRLATELARRGMLTHYVRPYTNKRRVWERALERTPILGRFYLGSLGRRVPPEGLPIAQVIEAGVLQDFAVAGLGRLVGGSERWRSFIRSLQSDAERAVARVASRYASSTDVVVASYGTGLEAFAAVKRRGGRAVLHYPAAHNRFQRKLMVEDAALSPEFARALPDFDSAGRSYEHRLESECDRADRILVGSSFARDTFVAEGCDPRKLVAIPFGVDTLRFTPPAEPRPRERFRVLFVGQISQRKGIGYLLRGYERFRKAGTELHLVGRFVPGSEAYERFRGLFRHTTHVPQAQLADIYRESDVLVFPSLTEGMGLVVLEAMASGLPVIATPHGPSDLISDGADGFLVPIRNPDAIAEKLEMLHRDPELRLAMGWKAREKALRFGWNVYVSRAADAVINVE